MPTWINGIPRDNGATDLEDSARLAGVLAITGEMTPVYRYYTAARGLVRHPASELPFTRDQLLCLAYLHYKYRTLGSSNTPVQSSIESCIAFAPNGKDYLNPAHRQHLRICTGGTPSLWGNIWLVGEICWHAFCVPTSESNQLICMLLTSPPMYVNLWKRLNVRWRESINEYWCGWRNEPELATALIKRMEAI